jgi:hypothetical protein
MNQPNQPNKRTILLYLAVLVGGVLLVDWALSKTLSMPAEATYLLTKASLNIAIVVAVLGLVFARPWLTMKVTLLATGMLALGLTLWVFSVLYQSPKSHPASNTPTTATANQSTYVVSTESFDKSGKPLWTLAHGKQVYTIKFDDTCTNQTAMVDCNHTLQVGEIFGESNVSFHDSDHVIAIGESKDGKDLLHFYEEIRVDAGR